MGGARSTLRPLPWRKPCRWMCFPPSAVRWSGRLGRSLQRLLEFQEQLHALGIDLYLHQQGSDTTTPAGKAMFQMCGVLAEFEQSIIRERINAELKRARDNGRRGGSRIAVAKPHW
ncbi:MAG: recombinase family protein [SAR324 cluster bacterium]|nr:recombinase family protein [SAR324 cluster bacterium]